MTSQTRTFVLTGAALAAAGALIAATPTVGFNNDVALASAPDVTSISSAFELMSYSEGHGHGGSSNQGQGAVAHYDDDDDEAEDDDNDHHGGGFGGFGNIGSFITDYLDNNQAQVLAVTAGIPTFNLGPVAVGNSLLANAYYTGFDNGSGNVTGVPGVVAYVTSQIGVPPANLVQGLVLSVTSLTPVINVGPVAIGNGLLANAYFSGYNGSATGVPGLVSYVTSQLGIQAAPASAVKAAAVASTPSVVAARSAATVAAPEVADSSAAVAAKADSPRAGRSAAGRGVAKAASAAKASAARSAAK